MGKMEDNINKEIKKRVLIKYASSPLTLVPALVGITTLVGSWAVDAVTGMTLFAGSAMLLISGGNFLTSIVAGSGSVEKQVVEEIREEENEVKEESIKTLKAILISDGDRRTEDALDDLIELVNILKNGNWSESINSVTIFDIMSKIDELYDGCINSLKKSFELWEVSQKLKSEKARENILTKREEIIEDVLESINKLGELHGNLVEFNRDSSEKNLVNLRKELDTNLEIAKNVESKMKSLNLKNYKEEDFL